jgi:hypothetical protein
LIRHLVLRRLRLVPLAIAPLLAAACGSGEGPSVPSIPAARTFELVGFQPAARVRPGRPVQIAFTIRQPSGAPLTAYRGGSGPHTGIHLIMVGSDLRDIIHRHPPIGPRGRLRETVTFPRAGRYRLVVDAYPNLPGRLRNFQLFRNIVVGRPSGKAPLPPFRAVQNVGGFRVALSERPRLKAIEPAFFTARVTRPDGTSPKLTPWLGALAHAIFFRAGTLDYFHTHVCAPGAVGCTTTFGGTTISGTTTKPGRLRVGVLLPVPGTWRLFLQFRADGRVVTAPFTLRVT